MGLTIEDLGFGFPGQPPVLAGLDLSLARGARLAILGGNGSGKTTLGRCLTGQIAPDRGQIMWDGRPLPALGRAERAMAVQGVCQRPYLQFSGRARNLREEVAFGPENLGLPPGDIALRVAEALAALGLEALAGRDCGTLSGGEAQRVILAGALAMRPGLLVLDEPMTDLDAEARARLGQHLRSLSGDMAVIFLETGHFPWMDGLVTEYRVLEQGRLSPAIGPADLPHAPLPEALLRPPEPGRGVRE